MSELLPHQQRVVIEKNELDEKLSKLKDFLITPTFDALSMNEQDLLQSQASHMQGYSNVLGERIATF